MWRGRTWEWVRRAPGSSSRLISISLPSMSAGVYRIRAPMSAPSSMTTVPGPDGLATGSVMLCSLGVRCGSRRGPDADPRRVSMRSGRLVVPAVRNPEVGEIAERGGVDAGRRQPVGEYARGGVGGVLGDQRVGESGERPQLDRDDVVRHPAPVREAGQVAAEQPENVRIGGRL